MQFIFCLLFKYGLFTINANGDQVYFSQGNLQYIGSASIPYWKFADNQWDIIGTSTGQNSDNPNIDRDLFGWSTSGYNHGAICFQPWSISMNNGDYYAYGNYSYNLYDQTCKADWGYNSISNGGHQENSGWRTPTREEWRYLFYTRNTASGIRYARAQVNGINGMILLPDNWSSSYYALNNTNSFTSNIITLSEWSLLEQHGAVFLPTNVGREGTTFIFLDHLRASYWSSSYKNDSYAWVVIIDNGAMDASGFFNRYTATSVRLIHSAQANSNGSRFVVIDGSELRLRLGPSTSSDTFKWPDGTNRHPNVGDKFKYLGEKGDFFKIDFNGNEVWVSKQYTHLE